MPRQIYVVAPNTTVDASVVAASNGAEIAHGVPPRIAYLFPNPTYPFTYTEPADPALAGLQQAAAQLRSTFGTTRTAAQVNASLDAITLILRRLARNELDR